MQNTGMEGSNPTGGGLLDSVKGSAGAARITETAQQALERITRAAHDAAERLSERSEELWALQGRAMESARGYAKQHPVVTVGVAIAIGVLLARLISSRR